MANVAAHLWEQARRAPDATALVVQATGERLTFAQLADRASRLARGLESLGIGHGDRVLLMIRPGVDFAAAAFAVLGLGAVAVFIDPGIGRRHLVDCIAQAKPKAVIAVPLLYALTTLHRRALEGVQARIASGWWPGARALSSLATHAPEGFEPVTCAPDEAAVVAFTTGSTGSPKGVLFPHRVLAAQLEAFLELTRIGPGDVYLAILPILAILGPGFGCATVLPELNAAKPASANPAKLVAAIQQYGVTHSFGSPTVWRKIADECVATGVRLPTLRCVLIGGAPVPPALLEALTPLLPPGSLHTPYGATEAVPLSCAPAAELLAEAAIDGRGALVGRPLPGVEVRVLPIVDGPLDEAASVPRGEVGEIAVRAAVVSPSYQGRPEADALAKVADRSGAWHRMGDLGSLDAKGRLWFCGRKSERVVTEQGTFFTACVEPRFERHPAVRRAALVGVGGKAVLVVEPRPGFGGDARLVAELLALKGEVPISQVLFRRALPLDGRHAAKILRGELAQWAQGRVR